MMPFLYFPEDKTEYIPAAISLIICLILCYFTFRFIKRYSMREEEKMKQFEEDVMHRLNEEKNHES